MSKKSKLLPYIKLIKIFWVSFFSLLLLFALFIYSVNINLLNLFGTQPNFHELENPSNEVASELYSADGFLLGKYYRENRSPVTYDEIPSSFIGALKATEDVNFEKHSGIDFRGTFRVIIMSVLLGEEGSGGGSTITQQLAKTLFNTRSEKYKGKLGNVPGLKMVIIKTKEWITAIKLENRYTKEEILKMYLNTVDFGSNSFGLKVAAKTYFSKEPQELNLQESAMLVGLVNKPTRYNPVLNPDLSLDKRNFVLYKMRKYNVISEAQYDSLKTLPIELDYNVENHNKGYATYFRHVVRNQMLKWCDERGIDLYGDGLKIYTTIDSRMQKYAEEAVKEHMSVLQEKFFEHWKGRNPWVDEKNKEIEGFIERAVKRSGRYRTLKEIYGDDEKQINKIMSTPVKTKVFSWKGEIDTVLSPIDSIRYFKHFLHAGMMSMAKNGQIKAWVGGINHKYFKYDHVYQGKRQTGSTFKAFVYAAAMENGFNPCYEVDNLPVTIALETGETWTPVNGDSEPTGEKMTIRQGMAQSLNTIAAYVLTKVGVEAVIDMADRLGIDRETLPAVPSVVLGAGEVSVYNMVGAYNTFLNNGVYVQPSFILKIEDKYGNLLQEFVPKTREVINEETADLMIYMLQGATQEKNGSGMGLHRYGLLEGNEVAAKTGTTQNNSDGWFMGFTKDLVTGVWVGGDDRSIHFRTLALGQGSRMALPIWALYMKKVYEDKELGITRGPFPAPKSRTVLEKINCDRYKVEVVGEDSVTNYVAPSSPF